MNTRIILMDSLFVVVVVVGVLVGLPGCLGINVRIVRNRDFCIFVPVLTTYMFQYSVSGENPENIHVKVQNSSAQILLQLFHKPHHSTTLTFPPSQTPTTPQSTPKICFSLLDTIPKFLSFDLTPIHSPMRPQILQKDLNTLYDDMQGLYRKMETLYRNQHFYYIRNRVQRDRLGELGKWVPWVGVVKIGILGVVGVGVFWGVRRVVEGRGRKGVGYTSVPTI